MTTPVLFRMFRGEVTAILPTIEEHYGMLVCYAHMGQHSGCSIEWLRDTTRATPDEYAPLLRELVGQGYDDLKIYSRLQYNVPSWRGEPWRSAA